MGLESGNNSIDRNGHRQLKIVDRDVIEISNLHRQHLYTDEDIGKVKVEAAWKG